MDSFLFNKLKYFSDLNYFAAKFIPYLASRSPLKVILVSFLYIFIIFWAFMPCFLAQGIPAPEAYVWI